MTQIHKPLHFAQGETWEILGNLAYADGTPFDLGDGAAIGWKVEDTSGNLITSASLAGGQITTTDVDGQCLILLSPGATASLPVGSYVDQLQASDPTGYTSLQWQGPFSIIKSFFV